MNMKKIRKVIIPVLLITALLTATAFAVITFKDTKPTDWYMGTVSELVKRDGIKGYPDGTFKPNDTITKAEFTKVLLSVLGHKNMPKTNKHWASGYMSKAEEIRLINKGELMNIDNTISRNEMAKMSANALDYLGEDQTLDRSLFKSQIKDFDRIPNEYQDYVLKTYSKGIITGYPDGTFKGDRGLTRAEASTVVIRILEIDERILPEKPAEPVEPGKPDRTTELSEEDIKRLQSYPLNGLFYVEKEKVVREDYISFKEYYAKMPEDCEAIYRKQLWTPINYPPNDIKGKTIVKWISSPRLIYNACSSYGIRGILQKKENGKTYEADYELMITNTTDGTYLIDDKYKTDYSGALSEWKEVK